MIGVFPGLCAGTRSRTYWPLVNFSTGGVSMSKIDPDSAQLALSDIARVERRAFEAAHYGDASNTFFLWSALTTFGYLFAHFAPNEARGGWVAVNILGVGGMAALGYISRLRGRRETGKRPIDHRPSLVHGTALLFGLLWFVLLTHGDVDYRAASTYFPTLFMFGLIVMGLWIGRFLIIIGVVVTVLVLAVYLWSGPWFDYLMAVCVGGVLAAAGVWFRRLDMNA